MNHLNYQQQQDYLYIILTLMHDIMCLCSRWDMNYNPQWAYKCALAMEKIQEYKTLLEDLRRE